LTTWRWSSAAAADAALAKDEAVRQLVSLRNERIAAGDHSDDNIIRKVAARMSATIQEARMSVAMVSSRGSIDACRRKVTPAFIARPPAALGCAASPWVAICAAVQPSD
jgi:hypothetical protein